MHLFSARCRKAPKTHRAGMWAPFPSLLCFQVNLLGLRGLLKLVKEHQHVKVNLCGLCRRCKKKKARERKLADEGERDDETCLQRFLHLKCHQNEV